MRYGIRRISTNDFSVASGSVRRCVPQDGAALAAIYDPIVARTAISFEEVPPGPNEMGRRIVAAGDVFPWLGLDVRGEIVGYAYASQHRSRAAYRWSVDVSAYVAPAAQRCGVGGRLYAALLELLAGQGYCAAFAGVALPNAASLRLHRGVGFTEVGTYRAAGFKFGRWHDVCWLERRLLPVEYVPGEIRRLDWAALRSPI